MITELITQMAERKIIAVLRGDSAEQVIQAVDALAAGGISLIEVTFTNENPLRIIEKCNEDPNLLVGAGTVLSLKDAREAVEAGAKYLVSPCLIPEIVKFGIEKDILVLPGVFTPTEVFQALQLGAKALKLFPGNLGGPQYIKSLKSPFPGIQIVPTGGVDKTNIQEWFSAGALAVGLGANLAPREAIARDDYETLTFRAKEIMTIIGSEGIARHA